METSFVDEGGWLLPLLRLRYRKKMLLTTNSNSGTRDGTSKPGQGNESEWRHIIGLKEEVVRKMKGHIEWIVNRIGPRPPCGQAEKDAAEDTLEHRNGITPV